MSVARPEDHHQHAMLAAVADAYQTGRRLAMLSMAVSALLAATKITIGLRANSTAVVADGFESAGDVLASGLVMLALVLASLPPDENHPYGHGRVETLMGLAVGVLLCATGTLLTYRSLDRLSAVVPPPEVEAIWPLLASIFVKLGLTGAKFRIGRRIQSDSLLADAWNDSVDIVSGSVALGAVGLNLWRPESFARADRYGGAAVGVIVILLGFRVIWETAQQLIDTMPDGDALDEIRRAALSVQGARGIEKCYARKTGLQYHVDLHLEVDPQMTVLDSHEIARDVRSRIRQELPWVADVLVHVEPYTG